MRRAGDNIKDEANDFGEAVELNLDREGTELPGGEECYLHGKKSVAPIISACTQTGLIQKSS